MMRKKNSEANIILGVDISGLPLMVEGQEHGEELRQASLPPSLPPALHCLHVNFFSSDKV